MKKIFAMVMMVVAFAIAGCDNGDTRGDGGVATLSALDGTYSSGKMTLVFSPDGEVKLKGTPVFPGDKTTKYKIKGEKVSFQFPEGYLMTLSINPDGSLSPEPLRDTIYKKVD